MKCPYCSQEIEDGSQVCAQCGRALNTADGGQEAREETLQDGAAGVSQSEGDGAGEVPKKGKRWVIPVAAAGAAVVVAGGIFAMTRREDPKETVINAFKSITDKEQPSPADEMFGSREMGKLFSEGSMQGTVSLTLESCMDPTVNSLATGSLEIGMKRDMENKKASVSYGIGYGGMELADMELYFDEKQLVAAVPVLSSRAFTLNYGEDLEGQIAASPYLGTVLEQYGVDVGGIGRYMETCMDMAAGDEKLFDLKELWERYKEGSRAIDNLKEAMTVEKTEKKEFTIDGKQAGCSGYHVVITKEAMIDFLDVSREFFLSDETLKSDFIQYMELAGELQDSMRILYGTDTAQSPETMQQELWDRAQDEFDKLLAQLDESLGDVAMNVYVRKDKKMAGFDFESAAEIDGEEVKICGEAAFAGGYNMGANMTASVELAGGDGETIALSYESAGAYEKDKSWETSVKGTIEAAGQSFGLSCESACEAAGDAWDYTLDLTLLSGKMSMGSLSSNGVIEAPKKGESLRIAMDSIRVESPMAGAGPVIELSGSCEAGPLAEEVTAPEGEPFDVLAATEEEYQAVGTEIYGNLFGLALRLQ